MERRLLFRDIDRPINDFDHIDRLHGLIFQLEEDQRKVSAEIARIAGVWDRYQTAADETDTDINFTRLVLLDEIKPHDLELQSIKDDLKLARTELRSLMAKYN